METNSEILMLRNPQTLRRQMRNSQLIDVLLHLWVDERILRDAALQSLVALWYKKLPLQGLHIYQEVHNKTLI